MVIHSRGKNIKYEKGTKMRMEEMAILSGSGIACLSEEVAFVPSSEGDGSEESLETFQVGGTAGTKTSS